MTTSRRTLATATCLALAVVLSAPRAQAGLKIYPQFIESEPPSEDLIKGGGDLQEIFQVAAEAWEAVFKRGGGNWKVTIRYGWGARFPPLFGKEVACEQDGRNPVRITRAYVEFARVPPVQQTWFADPTPRDSTEYGTYTSYDLEDLPLNRGRIFSDATGDAAGRMDLLTLAIHEIGHALGIDLDYLDFQKRCPNCGGFNVAGAPITAPRPFAGIEIAMTNGPHIRREVLGGDDAGPVMSEFAVPGERQLISGMDALLIAQLSLFRLPYLGEPRSARLSSSAAMSKATKKRPWVSPNPLCNL